MQREARQGISAGNDLNAGVVEFADHAQRRALRAFPGSGVFIGDLEAGRLQGPVFADGKPVNDLGIERVGLAGAMADHGIEHRHRGVHHDPALGEELQEIPDCVAFQVQGAGLVAIEIEADLGARVLGLAGQEVEKHHIDVLDLVEAVPNRLLRRHESGDVAADPEPPGMGKLGERTDPVRRDGAVELDLDIAVVGIPGDHLLGRLQRVDGAGRGEGAGLVDEAGVVDAGADERPGVVTPGRCHQRVVIAAHIAHAGDAAGNVENAAVMRKEVGMRMHVPEAGDQGLARAIDTAHGRHRRLGYLRDPAAVHQHMPVWQEFPGLDIDYGDVFDRQRLFNGFSQGRRDSLVMALLVLRPDPLQLVADVRSPPLGQHGEAPEAVAKQRHVRIQPRIARRETQAGYGIERDVPGDRAVAHACRNQLRDPRLARGQEPDPALGGRHPRPDEGGDGFGGAGARGHVERRRLNRRAALFRRAAPARDAIGNLEGLVDRRAEGRGAAQPLRGHVAVGIQCHLVPQREVAVVPLDAHVRDDGTVRLYRDGLRARRRAFVPPFVFGDARLGRQAAGKRAGEPQGENERPSRCSFHRGSLS